MAEEKTISQVDSEEIAKKGEEIYQRRFQKEYEPSHNGKFLAIEIESEEGFLGDTSVEAIERAKEKHPQKIFYIKKIGFQAAEIISSHLPFKYSYGRIL